MITSKGPIVRFALPRTCTNACVFALCLAAGIPIARAQAPERVIVPGAQTPHLHIAYDVTDEQYRQQLLALTPLGSTPSEVRSVVLREWRYEGSKLNQAWLRELDPIDTEFFLNSPYAMRMRAHHESPGAAVIPFSPKAHRIYMKLRFHHRPVFWGKDIWLICYYEFDNNKLIDIFVHAGVITQTLF